jgi:hypothetical protein
MLNYGMHVDKYHFLEIISSENNSICKFSRTSKIKYFIIRWLSNASFSRFARRRFEMSSRHLLLMPNRIFQMAIFEIRRVIHEYKKLPLLPKLFA